jgi:hypothetical protein
LRDAILIANANSNRACWISLQIEPRCHRARKMVTSEISFRF